MIYPKPDKLKEPMSHCFRMIGFNTIWGDNIRGICKLGKGKKGHAHFDKGI